MELIIKAKYEQDTRRLTVRNTPTYDQLEVVIRNLFSIPKEVPIILRYEDEDKDLITVSSAIELEEALSVISRQKPFLFRLFVSKGSVEEKKQEKKDEKPTCPRFPFSFEDILKNPNNLIQILQSPEILANLQKFSNCQGIPNNVNDLSQLFSKLGVGCPNDQNASQFQNFLPCILEIPFVKELLNNMQTNCPSNNSSFPCGSNTQSEQPGCSRRKVEDSIHYGVVCDNCEASIVGIRYKCSTCPDYDLCEKCEPQSVHNPEHFFLKIKKPIRRGCPYRRPAQESPSCSSGGQNWRNNARNRYRTSTSHGPNATTEPLFSRFVANVSIRDGTQFEPGESFVKIWKLRNEGNIAWPENTRLGHVGGDKLSTIEAVTVPALPPGQDVDVVVDMVAPTKAGRYVSYWRLAQPNGERFGQRVWVDIVVEPKKSTETVEESTPETIEESVPETMQVSPPSQEESNLFENLEQNVNELINLGFSDSGLIKALLEINENNLEKTMEDLFNLTKPKCD